MASKPIYKKLLNSQIKKKTYKCLEKHTPSKLYREKKISLSWLKYVWKRFLVVVYERKKSYEKNLLKT